jgi:hypothetical protein
MTHFCINDYGLPAAELASKYVEDGQHHTFTQARWKQADPGMGYWEWIEKMIADEQDELDRDNPYNQWMREV